MKRIKHILSTIVVTVAFLFSAISPARAADVGPFKQPDGTIVTAVTQDNITEDQASIEITLKADKAFFDPSKKYSYVVHVVGKGPLTGCGNYESNSRSRPNPKVIDSQTLLARWDHTGCDVSTKRGNWVFTLWQGTKMNERDDPYRQIAKLNFSVQPKGGEPKLIAACQASTSNGTINFKIENAQKDLPYTLWLEGDTADVKTVSFSAGTSPGTIENTFSPKDGRTPSKRKLCMEIVQPTFGAWALNCVYSVPIEFVNGSPSSACTTKSKDQAAAPIASKGDPTKAFVISGCGASGGAGIETALGCIPTSDTNALVGWFLKWTLGIAGGIAFILIVFAAFQIMTSAGSPEKIQGGKELLNAAISGLILIIFSLFLLKLIGVDILALPGFGV